MNNYFTAHGDCSEPFQGKPDLEKNKNSTALDI